VKAQQGCAGVLRLVVILASVGGTACTYNFDKFAVEQDATVGAETSPIGAGGIAGLGAPDVETMDSVLANGGATSLPLATGGAAGSTAATVDAGSVPSITGGGTGTQPDAGGSGSVATGGTRATGGLPVSGGSTSVDAAVGSGGVSVLGGALGIGGGTSAGGSSGSGGSKNGGSPMTGGTTTTGGTSAGGVVRTGGTSTTGGVVGSGGTTASGGVMGTGGTSATACGTAKSTFSETVTFAFLDGGTSPLALGPTTSPVPAGAQLGYTRVGPASNPTLCNAGCATLSMPYTPGIAQYTGPQAFQTFVPVINLVGATITFAIAIDNPGVPIQVQVYTSGDASTGLPWAAPTTISGGQLNAYAAARGFKDLSLAPVNGTTNKYCASASGFIGLQFQNTTTINSSNAGTVTIYIGKLDVKPPA
jgi:hypothetical protein